MKTKVVICDIDGVLLYHYGSLTDQVNASPKLLQGVLERFTEWESSGIQIILITGRKECHRRETESQLKSVGLFWDMLIMGVGSGTRYLINDTKPDSREPTAIGLTVERNAGLREVGIEGK